MYRLGLIYRVKGITLVLPDLYYIHVCVLGLIHIVAGDNSCFTRLISYTLYMYMLGLIHRVKEGGGGGGGNFCFTRLMLYTCIDWV